MKRLLAAPLAAVAACTVTVAPLDKHQHTAATHHRHRGTSHRAAERVQTPIPVPSAPAQVHEEYKPIYEKLATPTP